MADTDLTGSCLCGAVTFTGRGQPSAVHVCHCRMCAKWSGGPAMGVEFSDGIDFEGEVRWFASSDWGERGFCPTCGSSLFYRLRDGSYMNTAVGFLDEPAQIAAIDLEIFIDQKPDCYAFEGKPSRLTGPDFLKRLKSGQSLYD